MNHGNLFLPQKVYMTELATISSADSTYAHTVYRLIGGTNYTFWMTSSTAQGDGGIQSDPQTVYLPEDGQCCTHTHPHTHIYMQQLCIHKSIKFRKRIQFKQKVRVNIEISNLSGGGSALFFLNNASIFKEKKLHKNSAIKDLQHVLLKEIAALLTNWFYFCLPMLLCHGDRQFVFPFTKHETSCQRKGKVTKEKNKTSWSSLKMFSF